MTKPLKIDWANRKKPGSSNYRVGPHKKKGGTVPKDIALSDPVSQPITKVQRREIIKEQNKIEREAKKQEKLRADAAMKIATLRERINDAKRKVGLSIDEDSDSDINDDLSLSAKMLADMRWVYNQVDGRQKLLNSVRGDDKQFAFILKELMKYEQALAEKRVGGAGNGNGYGFFVVIRGLEDEKALADARATTGPKNEISHQRIAIQMSNPDGSEGESRYERKQDVAEKETENENNEIVDVPATTVNSEMEKEQSKIINEGDDW